MTMISSASLGNSLEAEPRADDPFVHRAAVRERRLFAVVGDRNAERPRVLERGAHEVRAGDGLAVVAHGDRAGADHLAEFGERPALLTDGNGPDRVDASRLGDRRLTDDEPDRGLVVGDRIGVGHRADGGEAAGRRGARAGGDRLDVFAAGLAQMTMDVDEAGRDDEAGAVDDLNVGRRRFVRDPRTTGLDASLGDQHVADGIQLLRWIDRRGPLEKDRS